MTFSQQLRGLQRHAPNRAAAREVTARHHSAPSSTAGMLSTASRCPCGGGCPRCADQGRPLEASVRSKMESRIGARFGDVRIHTDALASAAADREHARAFTIGTDIYFGAGRFAPQTSEGATRLAHELVHVEQQRIGLNAGHHASPAHAEREARNLGATVAAGAHVNVSAAAPHVVQHDGPDSTPATPQLHLDPEIERMMLQHYIRWWLGSTLVDGRAPTSLPSSPDPNATADAATQVDTPSLPSLPGLPYAPIWSQLPLDPPFFAPLPRDPSFIEPDVGSLFSGFGQRGAPVSSGDNQAVFDIYRRNQAIAGALPDLRALAPGFLRPLIPGTWRRDIAGALTGAAVGAYLNRDYATPIEVSDRAFQAMTGASTTVVPLPSISFDLF